MFGEESLGKINNSELFPNGSVHEFYRLKDFYYNFRLKKLITLEQVNTSVVEKKILGPFQTSCYCRAELNWSN